MKSGVVFRISFWRLLLYIVACGVGLGVPLGAVFVLLIGGPPNLLGLVFALAGGVGMAEVLSFLLVLVMVAYFTVTVRPGGLYAFNFWGLYREVSWGDVVSARRLNFLGLPYLLTSTADRRSDLWLPLFLADQEGFFLHVREHVGPEHPLALALHAELA